MEEWRHSSNKPNEWDLRDVIEWPDTNPAIELDVIYGVEGPEVNQIE